MPHRVDTPLLSRLARPCSATDVAIVLLYDAECCL